MTIDEQTVEERNTRPVKRVRWALPVSAIIGLTGSLIFYAAVTGSGKEESPTKVEAAYPPTKAEDKHSSASAPNIFTPEQVRGYTSKYVVCSMDYDWNPAKGGTDRETFVLGCNYFRRRWDAQDSKPLPECEAKNADSKSSVVQYCFRPEPSRKFLLPFCAELNAPNEPLRNLPTMPAVPTQDFQYKGRNALAIAKQDFDQCGIEGIILHGGWVYDTGRNYQITDGVSPFTLGRITENELGDVAEHFKNQIVGALREFETCREDRRPDNDFQG